MQQLSCVDSHLHQAHTIVLFSFLSEPSSSWLILFKLISEGHVTNKWLITETTITWLLLTDYTGVLQ